MAIRDDILTLKNKEGTLTGNKVCNFAYDDTAFEDDTTTGANGVVTYNYNNHNNIPVKDPTVLKVNPTIISKGFRSQVSTLSRMLLNHIFGRVSYNLNKTVDTFNSLLSNLYNYIGQPNGLATLDNTGRLPYSQLPLSAVEYKGAWNANTNTPTLASGTGTFGDEYIVSTQGTQNLGEGSITYRVGDRVIYNGSIWQRIPASSVRTVNTKTPNANGNVTVNASDIVTPDVYGYNKENDGKVWASIKNGRFYKGCYVSGLYLVGSRTGVWWSDNNGETWTQCTGNISSVSVTGINYANNLFLTETIQNGIWWSTDGKVWTQGTGIPSDIAVSKTRYANGLWVACTEQGLWWSVDGKIWTSSTSGAPSSWFSCVDYACGLWLAVNSTDGLYKSTDGKTWQRILTTSLDYIKYANDIWIASSVTNGIYWSEDGVTWTQSSTLALPVTSRSLYYADGLWLASCSSNSNDTGIYWSEDNGKTWTKASNVNIAPESFVYAKGMWVAGFDDDYPFWSKNGKSWTRSNSGYGEPFNDSGKWFLFSPNYTNGGIYISEGTATNNVKTILDWLLYAVDNLLS